MNIGDIVKLKNTPPISVKSRGKIIRLGKPPGRVSVMWSLEEGGILCQSEIADNLIVLEACTTQEE